MQAAFVIQARVIAALVLRETRARFGRSQLGYLWAIAEPLAYIVFTSLIMDSISRPAPVGQSTMLFLATGMLPYFMFSNMQRMVGGAFDANEALLTYPIVKPIDTLIGRAILESLTSITIMIIMFGGLMLLHNATAPRQIGLLGVALVGVVLLGFGVGAISAVIAQLWPTWRQVYDVASRPLILISPVFYQLDALPTFARDIVALNPLTHAIELFRLGYFPSYRSLALDVGFLFKCGLVLTLVGLAAERALRLRRA